MSRNITFTVTTSDRQPVYVRAIAIGTEKGSVISIPVKKVVNPTDTITVSDGVVVPS
jgi:hypothetical protein